MRLKDPATNGAKLVNSIVGERPGGMRLKELGKRAMHQIATQGRINRPINLVELAQPQNTLCVETVGINDPVIDFSRRSTGGVGRGRPTGTSGGTGLSACNA